MLVNKEYLCACVSVCMCAGVPVCMCACLPVCLTVCVWMCACVHVPMCMCDATHGTPKILFEALYGTPPTAKGSQLTADVGHLSAILLHRLLLHLA